MFIDSHIHAFADSIAERAVKKLEETANIKGYTNGTIKGADELMAKCGVDYGVLLPVATKPTQQTTINNWAKEEYKGRFISFGTVHPFADDACDELDRIKSLGLKGVKLHNDYQGVFIFDECCKPIYKRCEELGLPVDEKKFTVGVVSRLTDQKGFDLIAHVMEEICEEDVQLIVLGTGEEKYENLFRHYDWKYPARVSAQMKYSEPLSHRIYAGCDAFLMPSLFEPCGLSQLMALRYGTLPIVRETGGLKDTVEPYNEAEGTGTGFSFTNYNAHEMLGTIYYAEKIYYEAGFRHVETKQAGRATYKTSIK